MAMENKTKEEIYQIILNEGYSRFEEIFLLILKTDGVLLIPYEKTK